MARSKKSKSCHNVSICENSSLYEIFTKIHKHFNVKTLLAKVEQWDITNENQFKAVCNFECLVCFYKTSVFNDWKWHILSIPHLENCNKIKDLYSYVCTTKGCKVLLYGSKTSLGKHRTEKHLENFPIPPGVSILMAEVIKRFITKQKPLYYCSHCKKFEETPITHTVTVTNGVKNPIDFYCGFCRVTFFSCAEMIDYHSLTVEHMTLKCLDELCSTNNILFEPSNKKEKNKLLPNAFVSNSGILNNVVNIQLFQEPVINNDSLEKNDDKQNNTSKSYNEENMELKPNLSKPKYIYYFKQKMEILNKLRTFKDCLMKTLSYYCEPCDFIEDDKNKFLNHNQTKHPDIDDRLPIFCPTCSMYIYGSDTKDHNLTMEHSILLKCSQSFEYLENYLTYNTALINSIESNISNEISLNPEIKKQFELNNIDGIKDCQISNYKDSINNDTLLFKQQNDNVKETIITNSFSSLDPGQIKHNDTVTTSNSVKTINNKNTILPTVSYQPNVNEMMKVNINCVDMSTSTDDLSSLYSTMNNLVTNKKPQEEIVHDENKAYGEYVAQRLQYIDDNTVKQNIKLEIDFLFYEKIKQLSQKNIK